MQERHKVGQGHLVAICLPTCPEWLIIELALLSCGATLVALPCRANDLDACLEMLSTSPPSVVICGAGTNLKSIFLNLTDMCMVKMTHSQGLFLRMTLSVHFMRLCHKKLAHEKGSKVLGIPRVGAGIPG